MSHRRARECLRRKGRAACRRVAARWFPPAARPSPRSGHAGGRPRTEWRRDWASGVAFDDLERFRDKLIAGHLELRGALFPFLEGGILRDFRAEDQILDLNDAALMFLRAFDDGDGR